MTHGIRREQKNILVWCARYSIRYQIENIITEYVPMSPVSRTPFFAFPHML